MSVTSDVDSGIASDPLDLDAQRLDQCLRRRVTVRQVLDLLVRVDDGGVVAVEETADGRPRYLRQLVAEIHRDLAWVCNVVAAL